MKTVYDRMMENDSYQKTKDFIICLLYTSDAADE